MAFLLFRHQKHEYSHAGVTSVKSLTQKNVIPRYSTPFLHPNHLDQQKMNNFTATSKFRRNRFCCSNSPKHTRNWLFWGIFSFFLFLRSLFWELRTPNLLFHSSNVGLNVLNDWSMPEVYIKRNFQIWPKTKLYSLQSTVGWLHFGVFSTSCFVPPALSSDWTWPALSSVICHSRGDPNWPFRCLDFSYILFLSFLDIFRYFWREGVEREMKKVESWE